MPKSSQIRNIYRDDNKYNVHPYSIYFQATGASFSFSIIKSVKRYSPTKFLNNGKTNTVCAIIYPVYIVSIIYDLVNSQRACAAGL